VVYNIYRRESRSVQVMKASMFRSASGTFFLFLLVSQAALSHAAKVKVEKVEQRGLRANVGTNVAVKKDVRCSGGETKVADVKPECRLKKTKDGEEVEFTFQAYLFEKSCPKFSTAEVKAAIRCWADQSPCKEYSMEDLVSAFEGCSKQKLLADAAKSGVDGGQNAFEKPEKSYTKPVLAFHETFDNKHLTENTDTRGYGGKYANVRFTAPAKWDYGLSSKTGVFESSFLGSSTKSGNALVFNGNAKGVNIDSSGSRYITTQPIDVSEGGVISFYLKDGPDDGDAVCKAKYKAMMKKEGVRIERRETERKLYDNCLARPPCNGHGTGVYSSPCFKNGKWVEGAQKDSDEFKCFDKNNTSQNVCTCKCATGYKEPSCLSLSKKNTNDGYSRCRSVGDPHPNTANGASFNLYDAGEFVWSRHPDVNIEARLVTRPAGRVAVNKGFALRKCGGGTWEDGTLNKNGAMKGPCDTVSMYGCSFHLEEDGKCMSKGRSFTSRLGIKVTGNTISVDGWSIQYSCGSYMDSYLTVKSPRDGKSVGLCGNYGSGGAGSDRSNGQFLATSGSRGSHRTTSREFFEGPLTIKDGKDSYFTCGGFAGPSANGHYHFKRIFSQIKKAGVSTAATAKASMEVRQKMLSRQLMEDHAWSMAHALDPRGDEVSSDEATKICESTIKKCSGLPVADSSAMSACVADYVKVGRDMGKDVLKGACDVVKEDEENAMEDVQANEADEKLELVDDVALRMPGKTDPVVQWCVEDCKYPETKQCLAAKLDLRNNPMSKMTLEQINKLCIWKQLKAFPAKLYAESNWTKDWRLVTLRIPQEAIDAQLKPRNPANKGQKMQLRIFQEAHTCYCCDVFGVDDIKVTTGGWPVRILADEQFSLYADGNLIGSGEYGELKEIYRFRVDPTSRSFAVHVKGEGKGRAGFIATIGDSIVSSSTWKCKDLFEAPGVVDPNLEKYLSDKVNDDDWGRAVEMGTNQGEGTPPWGSVPGLASKAFWTYTHAGYQKGKTSAVCRVDAQKAWHSYSKDHLAASRWSCKSMKNRQSPFMIHLTDKVMKFALAMSSDTSTDAKSVQRIGSTVTSYDDEPNVATILMKVSVGEFLEKAEEGAMIKAAILRLFVTDPSTTAFKYCKNTVSWKASEVTYDEFHKSIQPKLTDCRTMKANVKNEYVPLDITDWVRDWASDRKKNFGFTIIHEGVQKDAVGFATSSSKGDSIGNRPRLSLSCHGDHIVSDMVFKSPKVSLRRTTKK
jgi:hypothetical protein